MSFLGRSLKDAGIRIAKRLDDDVRNRHYNSQARLVLAAMEAQQGPTDKKSIALADEYARDVLGDAKYAPWLHVYTAVRGRFAEGWIPDNYYGMVVEPLKSGDAARVSNLKSFTNRILNTEALPDLAYVIDGIYYSRTFVPVPETDLPALLFEHDDRVFFKADNSLQGRSVSILTQRDFQQKTASRRPDGVFQAPIRQHGFLARISPQSTATLRITTARELDGTVNIRAAYLRLGRASDEIVRSSSHVRVSVDTSTGALAGVGYLPDWRRIEKHPDTGFRFAAQSIPRFDEATRLCRSLHESCPHIACIGWDTCIDEDDKVKIMEWNARFNDIKFSEATMGPCFAGLGWEGLWR
jgi:hypothetical protein